MKQYTITYLFEGTERIAVISARSLHWAKLLGPLQLMAAAVVIRIEETN